MADIGVIAIIFISTLFAFMRGLVRELLSIAAWIAAGFATYFGLVPLRFYARQYTDHTIIADIATGAAIFLATLVVASVILHLLSRNIGKSAFGPADRALGLVFGLARGGLLVCALYVLGEEVMDLFLGPDERPQWYAEAKALPYVRSGGEQLKALFSEEDLKAGEDLLRSVIEPAEDIINPGGAAPDEPAETPGESGYNDTDRQGMTGAVQQVASP